MTYAKVTTYDINNGPGFRISFWIQGCSIRCKGCQNQHLWDFTEGLPISTAVLDKIAEFCEDEKIDGLTIIGGEPLDQNPKGYEQLIYLINKVKLLGKNVWLYTGHVWENVNPYQKCILLSCDYVVDGPYIEELRDTSLAFRGSSNQRIIDVKETIKNSKITEICYSKLEK